MYADGFVSGYARGLHVQHLGRTQRRDRSGDEVVKRKMGNVTLMALAGAQGGRPKGGRQGRRGDHQRPGGPEVVVEGALLHDVRDERRRPTADLPAPRGPHGDGFRRSPRGSRAAGTSICDVLDKLNWGALYFYYGDRGFAVEEKMLIRHMYPFTLEELHAGWIKGKRADRHEGLRRVWLARRPAAASGLSLRLSGDSRGQRRLQHGRRRGSPH